MKKKIIGMLSAALILLTGITGCADSGEIPTDPDWIPPETTVSAPMEDGQHQPGNELVFMGGAMFTGMIPSVNENYDDGTYYYEDLTEDRMTKVVNCSFASEITPAALDTEIERVLEGRGGDYIRDVRILEMDDKSNGMVQNETRLVYWTCGENEDTCQCVGVICVSDAYSYLYFFSTQMDAYDAAAEETWLQILERIELHRM